MEMIGRVSEKTRLSGSCAALHFTVIAASLGPHHLSSWPWHPLLFLMSLARCYTVSRAGVTLCRHKFCMPVTPQVNAFHFTISNGETNFISKAPSVSCPLSFHHYGTNDSGDSVTRASCSFRVAWLRFAVALSLRGTSLGNTVPRAIQSADNLPLYSFATES